MLRNWSLNPLAKVAIGILRKYGTDAHVYLPGIGTVSGLTAGNYLDSAGTTQASVDNPVGLSLDALQAMTLGSELVTAQDLTTWTPNKASVVVNNATTATYSADAQITKTVATVAGKSYWLTISGSKTGGAVIGYSNSDQNSSGVIFNGNFGTYAFVAQATGSISIRSTTAQVLTISSISVREIPGLHATKATTANKPILRQSGGKYSWQFDGVNDSLSLSAPLFQMSDDHCVIAGFKADAANKYIFSQSHSGTATQCCSLRVDASGYPGAVWIDDASANALPTATTSCIGLNTVATAIKIGNAKRLRVNGVQAGATNNTALGVGTTNSYSIGCLNVSSGNFQGSIYPVIAIKGTVSDADLLTLERFVGQLSGVSI